MKKKIMSFALAASMVLSMPAAIFAAEAQTPTTPAKKQLTIDDNAITPMSISSSTVGASRKSSTSGSVSASASFSKKATKATCTITLQEKYNGSWRTATGLPVKSYTKTASNVYSISVSRTFTLKSGKVYRAKVVFSEKNSSGTNYKTHYTGSF